MSDELKPCPFCGGRAELYGSWQDSWIVECTKCHASTNDYKENFDAIFAWNTRADDALLGEKSASSLKESTEDTQVLTDSREQLEADIAEWCDNDSSEISLAKKWLDRQAAITEREVKERVEFSLITQTANALFPDYQEQIAELTAERDQLTNAINELQKKQPYCYNPEQPLDTLSTIGRYIDELTAEVEAQRKRANDAERGVLNGGWYVSRDRYEDDIAELKAEREKLLAELEAYRDFEKGEFVIPLDEAMKFTTDPPGYVKKHIAELQAERDELRDKLHEKQHVCDVQRDSFLKLEREYRELKDVCGELERTVENLRGD